MTMSYDSEYIQPMRDSMTKRGFTELKTADEVEEFLTGDPGTTLVYVNSVCPVSAHGRKALFTCLESIETKPDRFATVFAGQDREATGKAREFFTGYPPSSPAVVLLKNGAVVYMMEQPFIRVNEVGVLVSELKNEIEKHCK